MWHSIFNYGSFSLLAAVFVSFAVGGPAKAANVISSQSETTCYFIIDGKNLINGPCLIERVSIDMLEGHVKMRAVGFRDEKFMIAIYSITDRQADAVWGKADYDAPKEKLTDLIVDRNCWHNDRAKICFSNLGKN